MIIAAVQTGVAGRDVPLRGDVLVIKDRVGHLTTWGRIVATTQRRAFAARMTLKYAIAD